jgi:hypothetical protein
MGVLAHRLRTLDRSLVPLSTRAEIFRRTCLQSHLKHLPQPLQSHILSFGTLGQLFEMPLFPHKNRIVWGVGGVPKFFFWLES